MKAFSMFVAILCGVTGVEQIIRGNWMALVSLLFCFLNCVNATDRPVSRN